MKVQVLAMLDEAKRLIDEGRMTPEELDRNLLINLQVRAHSTTAASACTLRFCAGREICCGVTGALAFHQCHICNPFSTCRPRSAGRWVLG